MIVYTIICSILFIYLLCKNIRGLKYTFTWSVYRSRMYYWQRKHDMHARAKGEKGLKEVYNRNFPSDYKVDKWTS